MSAFRFEAEIDGSELESFVENVINNTIDYEMIANEVVKEIQISDDMLDDAVRKHIDYAAIADEVDVDSIAQTIVNYHMTDIQDALDIEEISQNVLERVDITELTNDVMNEMDIQSEIEFSFNTHLAQAFAGFDPEEKNTLNVHFCNAIRDAVTYLSKSGQIPTIQTAISSVDESSIEKKVEKSFTPDDILSVVSSCVISSMYGVKSDSGISTDDLINRSINSLPGHIRNFITNNK